MPNKRAPGICLLVTPLPAALKKDITQTVAAIAKKEGVKPNTAAWVRKVLRDTVRRHRAASKQEEAK